MSRAALPLAIVLAVAAGPARADDKPAPIAITGATIHVAPGKVIETGTLVIDGGVVRAAGAGVKAPSGARIIDGTGKVVTAGFIDAASRVGLVGVDAVDESVEGSFVGEIHAAYRVTDGFNPRAITVDIARSGGITTVVASPRGGLIAGQSAAMSLGRGLGVRKAVLVPRSCLHVTLGAPSASSGGGSRGMAIKRLREALSDAAFYRSRKASFDRNQMRATSVGRLGLDALGEVLGTRTPLCADAHRASDIEVALAVAAEFRLPLIVVGGTEAWLVADELARAGASVILNPMRNLPSSFDHLQVLDDAASRLRAAGVDVILAPLDDASNARTLRQVAGVAVARGMTWKDALAAVTTGPARRFGLGRRGDLEPGSVADVVLWSGDPFELSTAPVAVWIAGEEQPLENHQTRLLQRFLELPDRERGRTGGPFKRTR